jgi:uncharacterized membrane protein
MSPLGFLALALAGCGAEEAPAPVAVAATVDCSAVPDVSWDSWGDGFFRSYCTACHSSRDLEHRSGAPVGLDFDTEAAVRAQAANIRRVVLDAGTMPEGGGVQPDDLVLLDVYLACSAGSR